MDKFHVIVPLRNELSPLGFLTPVRHHDVMLEFQKCAYFLEIPIGIGHIGLHVVPPLVGQTIDETPLFVLCSHKGLLEFPVDLPFLHEGFPGRA